MQKTLTCRILAHLVENCGSQGKNRVLVIKQSTLGCDLIKKPKLSKDIDKKL